MYKLLAKSFLYPTQEVYDFIRSQQYQDSLSDALAIENLSADMEREIMTFRESISADRIPSREELEEEYNRLFAHLASAKCPPYETEYGYDNVFQKTQAMADIAGFYHAYQLEVADVNTERVDFLAMELEFMSYLTANEAYARKHGEEEHLEICLDTQRKFLRDHIGRWVTAFTKILVNATENAFYLRVGKLTEGFLDTEARTLGVELAKVTAPSGDAVGELKPFGCDGCLYANSGDENVNNASNIKFEV
ncbi:MAG: molecular chaperone TorD family protein [Ignavibacteriae bacterium]|nr:molecular chaperone TorD family protein [Ignavibacteriota bacterium]